MLNGLLYIAEKFAKVYFKCNYVHFFLFFDQWETLTDFFQMVWQRRLVRFCEMAWQSRLQITNTNQNCM